jgi:hypothetical protein
VKNEGMAESIWTFFQAHFRETGLSEGVTQVSGQPRQLLQIE